MSMLDPKAAAAVAYRDARQIRGMVTELRELYDGYNAPEKDRLVGGKYAIGRLMGLADQAHADDVLPTLEAAVAALVRYGDLLEVAALAIGDNPSWWEGSSVEDFLRAAKLEPAGFGVYATGDSYGLAPMIGTKAIVSDLVVISAEQAEELRGLGVYFRDIHLKPVVEKEEGKVDEKSIF